LSHAVHAGLQIYSSKHIYIDMSGIYCALNILADIDIKG